MADINTLVGKRDGVPEAGSLTTLTAETPATIGWDGVDERMCLFITTQAVADPTVVVSKGDGIRSSIGDLTLALAKSKVYCVVLDSMRFKDMSTGKVTIESTQADSVALIKLP